MEAQFLRDMFPKVMKFDPGSEIQTNCNRQVNPAKNNYSSYDANLIHSHSFERVIFPILVYFTLPRMWDSILTFLF